MPADRSANGASPAADGERLRRVFEDGPLAMALVDDDFRLSEVNDAFCRLTGYSADELAVRTFADITHPDDVEVGVQLARRVFAGEIPGFSIHKRYVRKTGEVLWVALTVSVLRDDDGRVLRGLGIVQDLGERRRGLELARAELERLARERAARERTKAAEAERARWARELHDETLQGLAAVHVLLSSGLRGDGAERLRDSVRQAREQVEDEMDKLRALIAELRPAALDELGLAASVEDLAERTQAVYGIEVETDLRLPGAAGPRRLGQDVETAAYRIVQECLSNAARHAGASRVVVEIAESADALLLRVSDDGQGFDPDADMPGFGLRGMRERVDLLDGRLSIGSGADCGTEVTVSLPQESRSEGSTSPRSSA